MQFINLTPHKVVIYDEKGENVITEINPCGVTARVAQEKKKIGEIEGIPVFKNVFEKKIEFSDTPPEMQGKIVIVPQLMAPVANILIDEYGARAVVSPDTSPTGVIRDEQGRIRGVKGFILLAGQI